jgi:hypothetical protein
MTTTHAGIAFALAALLLLLDFVLTLAGASTGRVRRHWPWDYC